MTIIIIAITAIISITAFQNRALMDKWIMQPYLIKENKEYYRFITSGFLHAGWMHLLINMFVLYSFGRVVELYFAEYFGAKGNYYFLFMYVAAIVISDIPTYLKNNTYYNYASLGASGAVAAVLFASILFQPMATIYVYFIPVPGIVLGPLYLYYSARMSRNAGDHINHDAHFYGAAFGFVFTALLKPTLIIYFFQQILNGIGF